MALSIPIAEYDPAWQARFAEEAAVLSECLSSLSPRIEHIGSTAVKGLGGKPIIDILVGCPGDGALDEVVPALLSAGYCYYACYADRFKDRRFFARLSNHSAQAFPDVEQLPDRTAHPPTHHVHVVAYDSVFWKRHLAFRDYLRQHPIARDAYFRMKVKLAKGVWESHNDYAKAKGEFIRRIERLAAL
ncbi:MAG: GrpB family protein [Bacteroidetes bacterium]|jgi:GrpB-like predicted nucleotidyltransferase (UPF0157 family)|nr:GrpB family protein [Bacteroidota bacterium]